jgi:KipI family sensor histidine kinase inhibitor
MRILPAGDRAMLVDLGEVSFDELHATVRAFASADGVAAAIPGHDSVLVLFSKNEAVSAPKLQELVESAARTGSVVGRQHRLSVSLDPADAPDLPLLLQRLDVDTPQFTQRLHGLTLRARWLGFISGFAYLEGLPEGWHLPRRATPRPRVPVGSLGVAGPMAGFYPAVTPGGWNLIGKTDALLWDPDRDPPNLIAPGDTVTIAVVAGLTQRESLTASQAPTTGTAILEVVVPGQMTRIVGAPDPRRYQFGLPAGGAFDFGSLAAANKAVGNPPDANAFECALVGPKFVARRELVAGWVGALAGIQVNGRDVKDPRRFTVRPGSAVEIGRLRGGMRGWLAIEGGIASGGPRWAANPPVIVPGLYESQQLATTHASPETTRRNDRLVIRVRLGPNEIPQEMRARILQREWCVTPALDRVGIRFSSEAAGLEIPTDLRSCGMQFGTMQWHPDGALVAMGPDHPITGGYLQPMTVLSGELWKLAQLQPGECVRWVER